MALCHKLGKFAFEVMPKRLPYGEMSEVERQLWARYLEEFERHSKPVTAEEAFSGI